MGIYDREYYREEDRGGWFAARTMVTNLMLINAAAFVAQLVFDQPTHGTLTFQGQPITWTLGLDAEFFHHPWQLWRFLTYGFLHETSNLWHIFWNMFGLWMFGRDVEGIYGRAEFLRIYLTTIVLSGLCWFGVELFSERFVTDPNFVPPYLIGASGGVVGIMLLYVLHFPQRLILIWGVLPIRAWALGGLYVLSEVYMSLNQHDHVAHVAHLGGAAFALVYYRTGWNLGRAIPQRWSLSSLKLRPRLKIHDPHTEERDLNSEVDRILEKISRQGESSLTKQERAVLERASRRYQQRRQ